MKTKKLALHGMLLLFVVLAACSGGTSTEAMDKPEDAMMEKPTAEAAEAMMDAKPTAEAMMNEPHDNTAADDAMKAGDAMMEAPSWYSVLLTDVNTGEAFTINDLKGKVILVETMAVWCSNCFRQQTQVKALHESLGMRDDFVSLGIDIDPNEDAAQLQAFTEKNGFDWLYAVAPAEVSAEFASLYGGQFLNPPSTPMLIIDRKGVAHPLPFGVKTADELLQALQPFLEEGM
ncbi:MAG: hypothetical protein Kow0070_25310 [Anaerolineales bacterium]